MSQAATLNAEQTDTIGLINFLAREDNLYPIESFVSEWLPDRLASFRIFTYRTVVRPKFLPAGLWIFADMDQMNPDNYPIATIVWDGLNQHHGESVTCLNRPGVSLSRKQLLERLYRTGHNKFTVHAIQDWEHVARFPVFIRHQKRHDGTLTKLLENPTMLRRAMAEVAKVEPDFENLIIVEFIDTSVDGLFRKYAAFRIGDTILPHHIFHASKWHVKASSLQTTTAMIAEERQFQQTNPHETRLREIFDLAGIQYGRIDYAMLEDEVQTWEINTNPMFLQPIDFYQPEQLPDKHQFARRIMGLLDGLAGA